MAGSNLLDAWIAVETAPGRLIAEALRDMNEKINRRYTHSELSKWRSSGNIPRAARNYMLRVCISKILRDELGLGPFAFTDEQLDRLADRLT